MLEISYKSDIIKSVLYWSFHDYLEGGQDPIEDWYDSGLSDGGRYRFDNLLKNMAKTKSHLQWGGFKFLKGEPKKYHIWQLDFIADGRQYRTLGVFGSVRRQAVLLVGCYHKGKVYTPPNALEIACTRASKLKNNQAETIERKIKYDL